MLEHLPWVISALGIAGKIVSALSGIQRAPSVEQAINQLDEKAIEFERLSDKILYVPTARVVSVDSERTVDSGQLGNVRQLLLPIQKVIGSLIVSSELVASPEVLSQVLTGDPWEFLVDIRPLENTQSHSSGGMIPLLFRHDNSFFIGWQTSGVLKQSLNCQIDAAAFPLPITDLRGTRRPTLQATAEEPQVHDPGICILCNKQFKSYFVKEYCPRCRGFVCFDCLVFEGFWRRRTYCSKCRMKLRPIE